MNDYDPTTELDIRPHRQWTAVVGLLVLLSFGLGASVLSYWLLLRSVKDCSRTTIVECAKAAKTCAEAAAPGPTVIEQHVVEKCVPTNEVHATTHGVIRGCPNTAGRLTPVPMPPALKMEDF